MATAPSVQTRRDELVERLFASALGGDGPALRLPGRSARAVPRARRSRPGDVRRAGRRGRRPRALRARVARAAGDGRHPRDAVDPDAADDGAPLRAARRPRRGPARRRPASTTWRRWRRLLVACALPIHALLDAFRTGDGVPYADYGADLHEGQARFTRPLFDALLATEWLPAVPAIHERLTSGDAGPRVADVACGLGRSSIAIARGYPKRDRRRDRPRRGLDRRGAAASSPAAASRTAWRSPAATPPIPSSPAATTS